ncbi:response regulator transcription factor [Phragmitibacter flavus]|uniref:Response regulator transcription factor n=1 Tax=Phragmitibacter flavus TaxID=2576071 RepID=A0A5R8KB19_9BACT|nr:response regulator transcription factor [Phragmitibacter flavus]TLD68729.1 response regulator transcription factor [Phragmitibacter flavus]
MPSVWIIEDNPAFRRGIERVLAQHPIFTDIQSFRRCEDALALLSNNPPETILLDIGLPGMDGIEGITRIKQIAPDTTILMLTVFEDDDKIFRAVCAGASGYLLKSEPAKQVIAAIEQALAGGSPMNPRVARRVLEMLTKSAPPRTVPPSPEHDLTDREIAVLELMVDGLARKQIADQLDLNPHTTDYIMRCIYKKLHVNCLASAISIAMKDGIVKR